MGNALDTTDEAVKPAAEIAKAVYETPGSAVAIITAANQTAEEAAASLYCGVLRILVYPLLLFGY
jgi:hypothetical protein